jgi:predicted GNAT family N-acyltransferase
MASQAELGKRMSVDALNASHQTLPRRTSHSVLLYALRGFLPKCRVADNSQLAPIHSLRYRVYVEQLGRRDLPLDHDSRSWPDADDATGIHLLVNGITAGPVAAVRLHAREACPHSVLERMGLTERVRADGFRCGYVSKLVVDRSARGGGASLALMVKMIEMGCSSGGDHAFFHCLEKLVPFYERLGFRRCAARTFLDPNFGIQIPMMIFTGDYIHFRSVGSPIAEFAKRFRSRPARIAELEATYIHGPPLAAAPYDVDADPDIYRVKTGMFLPRLR